MSIAYSRGKVCLHFDRFAPTSTNRRSDSRIVWGTNGGGSSFLVDDRVQSTLVARQNRLVSGKRDFTIHQSCATHSSRRGISCRTVWIWLCNQRPVLIRRGERRIHRWVIGTRIPLVTRDVIFLVQQSVRSNDPGSERLAEIRAIRMSDPSIRHSSVNPTPKSVVRWKSIVALEGMEIGKFGNLLNEWQGHRVIREDQRENREMYTKGSRIV